HLDGWRAWAAPVRAGRRVVLHPAWLPRDGAEDDLVVLLDPGRTFGSGSHPSTRLVVAALEAHCGPGQRVLDVGTGSGVLAVVAALLGAARVDAIDIEAAAPAVVRANAEANGVRERVTASTMPLSEVTGTFDLVLANIGAGVLRGLANELSARVAPGGLLVLSGLLEDQADAVVAGFVDLTELTRAAEDGWVAVVLRAPG
ncbi:MAG: 50S ribosomal protein L11 methyltransferase, partial [Acidimicrobiales bacterium]